MNTTTTVSGDQANEMVVKKKLLVFNDNQKGKLEALLRIRAGLNPDMTEPLNVFYKLKQCDQWDINFQMSSWQGCVRRKSHADVVITVEVGEQSEEEEEKEALVRRLCQCQFSLEMTKLGQFEKIELHCITLPIFQRLQRLVKDGTDQPLKPSDLEQLMVEKKKSILGDEVPGDLKKDELKWIEVVTKNGANDGDKSSCSTTAPVVFDTTIDKNEGSGDAEKIVATKKQETAGKASTGREVPKPGFRSVGSLVTSFLQMLVSFVVDLFASGKQLAINVGRRLTMTKSSTDGVSKAKKKNKKKNRGGNNKLD